MLVAVGMKSQWARRRTIELAELVDAPWVLPPDSWNSLLLAEAFQAIGLSMPKIIVSLGRLVTPSTMSVAPVRRAWRKMAVWGASATRTTLRAVVPYWSARLAISFRIASSWRRESRERPSLPPPSPALPGVGAT